MCNRIYSIRKRERKRHNNPHFALRFVVSYPERGPPPARVSLAARTLSAMCGALARPGPPSNRHHASPRPPRAGKKGGGRRKGRRRRKAAHFWLEEKPPFCYICTAGSHAKARIRPSDHVEATCIRVCTALLREGRERGRGDTPLLACLLSSTSLSLACPE